mmetsp:Transcript_47610/g.153052  ORF Transcript_47610/g.153052 Transcript_47610/m.153052 type:complete len:276 (-) Transcript_47610:601-1428(-)
MPGRRLQPRACRRRVFRSVLQLGAGRLFAACPSVVQRAQCDLLAGECAARPGPRGVGAQLPRFRADGVPRATRACAGQGCKPGRGVSMGGELSGPTEPLLQVGGGGAMHGAALRVRRAAGARGTKAQGRRARLRRARALLRPPDAAARRCAGGGGGLRCRLLCRAELGALAHARAQSLVAKLATPRVEPCRGESLRRGAARAARPPREALRCPPHASLGVRVRGSGRAATHHARAVVLRAARRRPSGGRECAQAVLADRSLVEPHGQRASAARGG